MRFIFTHSGKPGGQNVNKVVTKVHLKWKPLASRALNDEQKDTLAVHLAHRMEKDGEIDVTSEKTRSQSQNKKDAIERLHALVEEALVVSPARKESSEPRGAENRRITEKKATAKKKRGRAPIVSEDDFPA